MIQALSPRSASQLRQRCRAAVSLRGAAGGRCFLRCSPGLVPRAGRSPLLSWGDDPLHFSGELSEAAARARGMRSVFLAQPVPWEWWLR